MCRSKCFWRNSKYGNTKASIQGRVSIDLNIPNQVHQSIMGSKNINSRGKSAFRASFSIASAMTAVPEMIWAIINGPGVFFRNGRMEVPKTIKNPELTKARPIKAVNLEGR